MENWLEKFFTKIEALNDKMDKIDNRVDSIDKQLAIYNEQLIHHIEGVNQAKQQNSLLREYVDNEKGKIERRIEPLEEAKEQSEIRRAFLMKIGDISLKVIGAVATIGGLIYSILSI